MYNNKHMHVVTMNPELLILITVKMNGLEYNINSLYIFSGIFF